MVEQTSRDTSITSRPWVVIAPILLTILVPLLAINDRSLWIDEFGTWLLTQHHSFSAWLDSFLRVTDSDGQLPLYHFYMYLWTSLFGTSEIALRSANVPLFMIASWAIFQAPTSLRLRLIWLLVFSLHAFTWFYLNEARPYMMVLAGAALMISASLQIAHESVLGSQLKRAVAMYVVGCTLLVGASILGSLSVFSLTLALLIWCRHKIPQLFSALLQGWPIVLPCFAVGAGTVAIAFASFLDGARAASMGFSIAGVLYGAIEVAGLSGVAPGRNDLRDGLAGLDVSQLLPLAVACLLVAVVLARTLVTLPRVPTAVAILAVGLPVLVLMLLGHFLSMRIIGRHFAFLVVPISFLYAVALTTGWESRLWRYAAIGLAGVLIASTALIRFLPAHQKDDYARAARLTSQELCRGGSAWWAADYRGASYYGLLPATTLQRPDGAAFNLPSIAFSQHRPPGHVPDPSLIVLSKPESYDIDGSVRAFIADKGYKTIQTYAAFTLFARDDRSAAATRTDTSPECAALEQRQSDAR